MLKCETAGCDYGSKSKEDLENNIKSNHIELEITTKEPNNSIPDKNNISKKKKKFDCSACGAIRYSIHELKNHISRVHEGDKQFKCEIDNCEYASKNRWALKRHSLSIHEKKKKPFDEHGVQKKQLLTVHEGKRQEKKIKCSMCNCAAFTQNHNLIKHIESVHKDRVIWM